MKALQCEMCGSQDLVKDGGVFVCQSCGTKYSVEEAKKMMVEGTVDVKGTVKVDTSDELKNLYEIARRAKDSDNSENAAKYYDMILVKDPSSWEANYYVVYFKAMSCKIAEIWSEARNLINCQDPVVKLIKEKENDEERQKDALNEILLRNKNINLLLSRAAYSHYEGISENIKSKYTQEYYNNSLASAQILYTFGDVVEKEFGDKYSEIAVEGWKEAINFHYGLKFINKEATMNVINLYTDKIHKYDSSYTIPTVKNCYVASAVYGSYDCPEVWTLRRFRDFTLDETWYGRLFIKAYYATSPTVVKYCGNMKVFKTLGKKYLDKMVAELNSKGYDNTPYEDKY
jgi:hypothetical protein